MEINVKSGSPLDLAIEGLKDRFLDYLQEKTEVEKVPMGKVSTDLLEKFQLKEKRAEVLKMKVDARMQELALQLEVQTKAEFKEQIDELGDLHVQLWNELMDELNIEDREARYSINHKTGEVVKKVKKPLEDESEE